MDSVATRRCRSGKLATSRCRGLILDFRKRGSFRPLAYQKQLRLGKTLKPVNLRLAAEEYGTAIEKKAYRQQPVAAGMDERQEQAELHPEQPAFLERRGPECWEASPRLCRT